MKGFTQMRAFTLIELMIVMAIIGILAAIALPAYQDWVHQQNNGANATTEFISPIGMHRDAPAQQEHKQTPSTQANTINIAALMASGCNLEGDCVTWTTKHTGAN